MIFEARKQSVEDTFRIPPTYAFDRHSSARAWLLHQILKLILDALTQPARPPAHLGNVTSKLLPAMTRRIFSLPPRRRRGGWINALADVVDGRFKRPSRQRHPALINGNPARTKRSLRGQCQPNQISGEVPPPSLSVRMTDTSISAPSPN